MFCSTRLVALASHNACQSTAPHESASRGFPGAHGVARPQPLWADGHAGCLSAGRLKDLGNQAFKAGQNRFAKPKWERAIRLMDRLLDAETEEQVGPQRLVL